MPELAAGFMYYCPRCNRSYSDPKSSDKAMDKVKEHVAGQHPDHDPLWFETYPEAFGN